MKKREIIILLIICILAIASMLGIRIYQSRQPAIYVQVSVDGATVYSLLLTEDTTKRIETENGYNNLVIKDGYAYIKEADCPDLICVHHGKISKLGESIICLPHKVAVQIVNTKEDWTETQNILD